MLSLGQKLRELREAKPGLSLNELAVRARVDKHSLSLYERDKQDPSFSRLKRLCEALQIRAAYLFDELDEFRRLTPRQVAARESFRLLLQRHRLSPTERRALGNVVRTAKSPTTIEGWQDHLGLVRAGRSPRR
jgi:transcriptional regulator with XRE-family HTH domain